MMGVGLADARNATYWEYTAMLTTWNERHKSEDDPEEIEMPDFEEMKAGLIAFRANEAIH